MSQAFGVSQAFEMHRRLKCTGVICDSFITTRNCFLLSLFILSFPTLNYLTLAIVAKMLAFCRRVFLNMVVEKLRNAGAENDANQATARAISKLHELGLVVEAGDINTTLSFCHGFTTTISFVRHQRVSGSEDRVATGGLALELHIVLQREFEFCNAAAVVIRVVKGRVYPNECKEFIGPGAGCFQNFPPAFQNWDIFDNPFDELNALCNGVKHRLVEY